MSTIADKIKIGDTLYSFNQIDCSIQSHKVTAISDNKRWFFIDGQTYEEYSIKTLKKRNAQWIEQRLYRDSILCRKANERRLLEKKCIDKIMTMPIEVVREVAKTLNVSIF